MTSKKAAKPKEDDTTYELRDVVLAKVRGYPAWPAMISNPDDVPKAVKKERPTGKKAQFYCVRFFPAGDFAWVMSKDLSKLKRHEIEAYIAEPHKKNGDLLNGYRIALDPEKWEKEILENSMQVDESDNDVDEEVDQLDGEEEADEDKPKPKKRKRDSEAAAKTKTKPKKEKEPTEGKKRKTADKPDKPKSKKNGSKSKELVESEDDGDHTAHVGSSKKASPPPAKKQKREKGEDGDDLENDEDAKRVRDWRHKFQRAFLGKIVPKDEDMPGLDQLFSQVEDFPMTIQYLQSSKIGKVMRHIAALDKDKVPRDDEFKFKDRAQALVNKWHNTIASTTASSKANGANGSVEPSTANPQQEEEKSLPPQKAEEDTIMSATNEKGNETQLAETVETSATSAPAVADTGMTNGVEHGVAADTAIQGEVAA